MSLKYMGLGEQFWLEQEISPGNRKTMPLVMPWRPVCSRAIDEGWRCNYGSIELTAPAAICQSLLFLLAGPGKAFFHPV